MAAPTRFSKIIGLAVSTDLKGKIRSKSQKLFANAGLARLNNGFFSLSPLLVRSLNKLKRLVRKEMEDVSAMEILLPTLTDSKLLAQSGRSNLPELFYFKKEEKRSYYLNPTCEEGITEYMALAHSLTHKQLPCRLYQISNKFRDELRAKSGLIRSKEFIMKDLYCFDADADACQMTYVEMKKKYHGFFQLLNVPFVCVKGIQGSIGGLESNEFHYLSDAGDDDLILCQECGHRENLNSIDNGKNEICPSCSSKNVKICKGIEVGHTFNLGTRYAKPFNATYMSNSGKQELLHMSCHGLGLTRILAASVELLSLETEIRWPHLIAPYLLCIIPPKEGSKEEKIAAHMIETLIHNLHDYLKDEMIVDDRIWLTIGKRLKTIQLLGIPYVVIVGKDIREEPPRVEFLDTDENTTSLIHIGDVVQFVKDRFSKQYAEERLAVERRI